MKKVLSLVLATVVFATVLVSCGVSKKDIVGNWKCVDLVSEELENMEGDEFMDAESAQAFLKMMLASIVFEFKEDGTVDVSGLGSFMDMGGSIVDSKWEIKGDKVILYADGEESELEYKDNRLTLEKDGEKLVFEKVAE